MAARFVPWTKKEEESFLRAVKEATSVEDAVARARRAVPTHRDINAGGVDAKLVRLGKGRLKQLVAANQNRTKKDDRGAELAQFVLVARRGLGLEQLCDATNLPPKKVRQLVDEAKREGYAIELRDGHVGYTPSRPSTDERRVVAQPGEEGIFAVVSDVHIGSRNHLREYFLDFIDRAYAQGVRTIFVPGDILDGCYRHSRWEQTEHGFHDQALACVKAFPKKPGLRYVGITGNHDETFEETSGLSVVSSLPAMFRDHGRTDFQLVGARGAYVRFAPKGGRGILVEMWHPRKSPAYAVSYHLQRHVEGYAVGQKPDVLLAGHWHQQCYVERRGVHCFSCGTWQGGHSAYGRSLGGAPSIGGWVVKFTQTPQGTVRDLLPKWSAYYEREDVRELGLG